MRLQKLLVRRVTSLADVIRRSYVISSRQNHGGALTPSYLHGTSPSPLIGATIGQLLENRAEKTPDKEAVVSCQQKWRLTFQQLLQQVNNSFMQTK